MTSDDVAASLSASVDLSLEKLSGSGAWVTSTKKVLIWPLMGKIEPPPNEESGLDAVLYGDLARILSWCATGAEAANIRRTATVGSRQAKALAGLTGRGLLACDWLRGQDLNL